MKASTKKPKLIFVYNADSGIFNLLSDVAHKILLSETYPCNLCAITHTNFGMKKEWRQYLESLGNPPEFLHADEFRTEYKREKVELPAIFKQENSNLVLLLDAAAINDCSSVDDLKHRLHRLNLQKA